MKQTFVIGDIHGGLKALKQVLQKALVTKEDTLIFLGDYVDGWSESAQVISFLMDLHNEPECIFIKGNHDVWCEDWLRTSNAESKWLIHGGQATVESYANVSAYDKRMHLHFLERMPLYFIDVAIVCTYMQALRVCMGLSRNFIILILHGIEHFGKWH
jgi:serine/threonine protein phosphatase 1